MLADVVAFDSLGTIFDLGPLGRSVEFRRALHHALCLTVTGQWAPLDEILAAIDEKLPEQVGELEPYPEARAALETVRAAGLLPWILTNGGRDTTERLLERGGLRDLVAEVRSVEEVNRYKPHEAVYKLLRSGATLVAAHAWDTMGARAAGYAAIWVDREGEGWPLPQPQSAERVATLVEAAELATRR